MYQIEVIMLAVRDLDYLADVLQTLDAAFPMQVAEFLWQVPPILF